MWHVHDFGKTGWHIQQSGRSTGRRPSVTAAAGRTACSGGQSVRQNQPCRLGPVRTLDRRQPGLGGVWNHRRDVCLALAAGLDKPVGTGPAAQQRAGTPYEQERII
jgi:hypothetical protein